MFKSDDRSKRNNQRYKKVRLETVVDSGNAVPLQVRKNWKIMNIFLSYIYPNKWDLVNHKQFVASCVILP